MNVRYVISAILFCFVTQIGIAQSNQTLGFNYQAVIRSDQGKILKNQEVDLKIQLLQHVENEEVIYEEYHRLKSDDLGIVNTVIGRGENRSGSFDDIPWKSQNIWVNILIDEDLDGIYSENNYAQLLAVPYAMYARQAASLDREGGTRNDIPDTIRGSKYWQLIGNHIKESMDNTLGTTNEVDLVFITSDIERGKISAEGDVQFLQDLTVGGTIDVEDIAYFHSTIEVFGDIQLSGNITGESNAYFYENLTVALDVFIESNLYVTGNSELFGDLDVLKGDATLHQNLEVKGLSLFSNETNSMTKDDGSIVIEGGVGLEKNLNMGGNLSQDDPSDEVRIGKTLITNETQALDKDSGALVVEGGVGVEKDLWVGGDLNVVGDLKGSGLVIDGKRNGPDDEWDSYPVQVTGINQGIAVRTLEPPDSDNNFITFFDENSEAVGRIEGQTKIDILQSEEYIIETTFQAAAIASSLGSFASQAASDANLALDVGGVVVDFANHLLTIVGAGFGAVEGGAGLGDLICVIAIAVIDLAYSTIQLAGGIAGNFIDFTVTAFDATVNIGSIIAYQTQIFRNSGSTFSSGSADYAEWLPKMNPEDTFKPGDVVGIRSGKITKNISDAEKLMVISSDPIVLGNMPLKSEEHLYERVAFMGQVPVKVNGPVQSGDYLIADDQGQGFSKAISPEDISVDLVDKIIGVSWGSSELHGINYVNTAIGLEHNGMVPVLKNQVNELDKIKTELEEVKKYMLEREEILAELVPGYRERMSLEPITIDEQLIASSNKQRESFTAEAIHQEFQENNLFGLVDAYTQERHGDRYVPSMDNAQIMSMINKIDSEHSLDLSIFNSSMAGPFDGIEDVANDILNKDYIADFKSAITSAVSSAVQEVADQILLVKQQMLDDIASGADFTPNEKTMLDEKLNEILPIFDLMENSGQLVNDVISGIFEIIDDAACAICNEIDALPVHPDDIVDYINIPVEFTLEVIDFFVGTLDEIRNLEIGAEVCFLGECGGFSINPFEDIIPDLDLDVNDFPFVDNKQINIQFPDLCQSINCN